VPSRWIKTRPTRGERRVTLSAGAARHVPPRLIFPANGGGNAKPAPRFNYDGAAPPGLTRQTGEGARCCGKQRRRCSLLRDLQVAAAWAVLALRKIALQSSASANAMPKEPRDRP
jgi:hypothetical protein